VIVLTRKCNMICAIAHIRIRFECYLL
jgi:hypothetical protein